MWIRRSRPAEARRTSISLLNPEDAATRDDDDEDECAADAAGSEDGNLAGCPAEALVETEECEGDGGMAAIKGSTPV
jgi:hypothetical protein